MLHLFDRVTATLFLLHGLFFPREHHDGPSINHRSLSRIVEAQLQVGPCLPVFLDCERGDLFFDLCLAWLDIKCAVMNGEGGRKILLQYWCFFILKGPQMVVFLCHLGVPSTEGGTIPQALNLILVIVVDKFLLKMLNHSVQGLQVLWLELVLRVDRRHRDMSLWGAQRVRSW